MGLPIDRQLESSVGLKWYSPEYAEQSASELEALDEHRTQALIRLGTYQARHARAYNKRVRLITFRPGITSTFFSL